MTYVVITRMSLKKIWNILSKNCFFFPWFQLVSLLEKKGKETIKHKSFAYLALAFKVVWHTPLKTFKGGDPNNALCTIPSYSNYFSIVHPWELWLAETMWEWQNQTKRKKKRKKTYREKLQWTSNKITVCKYQNNMIVERKVYLDWS